MSTDAHIQQLSSDLQAHQHAHHQLVFGLQGHAEFQLEGPGGQRVAPNMVCIVPSDYRHAFQGLGRNQMLIVNLEPSEVITHPAVLDQVFAAPRYQALDAAFMRLLRVVAIEANEHPNDPWYGQHLSASLVHGLHHRMRQNPCSLARSSRIDMARLDRWIDAHLAQKIQVSELANLCHLSGSQFQVLFQHKVGVSPYQYVLRRRLNAASWLLQNTQIRIADIALEVGFAHQSAMTKAFRLYRNTTPALLRTAAQLH